MNKISDFITFPFTVFWFQLKSTIRKSILENYLTTFYFLNAQYPVNPFLK